MPLFCLIREALGLQPASEAPKGLLKTHIAPLQASVAESVSLDCGLRNLISFSFFQEALSLTWDLNSVPQEQESHALCTEPAGRPGGTAFLTSSQVMRMWLPRGT